MNANIKIERLPEVLQRTGLSRSSLYAAVKAGTFPAPKKLTLRAIGFFADDVDKWILERVAAR